MTEITQSTALTSPHAKQVLDIPGVNLVHLCRINGQHRGCQSDRHGLAIALQVLFDVLRECKDRERYDCAS